LYNFCIVLRILIQKFRWVAVSLVIIGAVVFVARKEHTAAQEYERDREARCVIVPLTLQQQEACKHERDSSDDYLQWWYVLVAWPNGITTWAIIGTGIIIAWQAQQTKLAAVGAKDAAEATKTSVEAMIDKERARIMIGNYEFIYPETLRFVRYKVSCFGPTPAFIKSAVARVDMLPTAAMEDFGSMHRIDIPAILKEGEIQLEAHVADTPYVGLVGKARDQSDIRRLWNSELWAHFRAEIIYEDVFGKERCTAIGQVYGGTNPLLKNLDGTPYLFWLSGGSKYNRQT